MHPAGRPSCRVVAAEALVRLLMLLLVCLLLVMLMLLLMLLMPLESTLRRHRRGHVAAQTAGLGVEHLAVAVSRRLQLPARLRGAGLH